MMNQKSTSLMTLLPLIVVLVISNTANAQLRTNFYNATCPNVEALVRAAVQAKFRQTFVTAPATLRLFFHDCFVRGCDASVMMASPTGNAEKDHPDNLSLAGDGFDTVIRAKAAVDRNTNCTNKVSCADILALATRDVVALVGGPSYSVELGRRDGRISTRASVQGRLPGPGFSLNQLNTLFASHGLDQTDVVALSGAHTIGFSHCNRFSRRIYNFSPANRIDPSLNLQYALQLRQMCPVNVDPTIAVNMDPTSPNRFDNAYFRNLQGGRGLFTSDQVLFTDTRSRATVNQFALNNAAFGRAFVLAMTKLGRVGVLTGNQGEIRIDCTTPN
ncbi:hypothetical protein ABFS82_10G138400 [Erythranthe guttata]|uniref:Peroxidase n=2 Tax=Erythranthe guttata TaxID=4155 RepID=A0A022RAD7_ERYGU|nr:hypothetical protein MIMGU_mgv1a009833mg [Erythranthe guttata]